MKLVKQQVNGTELSVLKENATLDDLQAEAARLRDGFGYALQRDPATGGFLARHPHFQGQYLLRLQPN